MFHNRGTPSKQDVLDHWTLDFVEGQVLIERGFLLEHQFDPLQMLFRLHFPRCDIDWNLFRMYPKGLQGVHAFDDRTGMNPQAGTQLGTGRHDKHVFVESY